MAKTIKDLDVKVNDLKTFFSSEINKFRNEIEKVKTPTTGDDSDGTKISVISNSFDLFSAAVNNRLSQLESQITALKKEVDVSNARIDRNIQYYNRNKLLLLGVKESAGEDLRNVVIDLVNSRLHISVEKDEIFYSYRLGKKGDKRVRPVVVEFCNMWVKNEVFAQKKLLKGTGTVISEFLSPNRYEVFKLAKQKFGKDCWTSRGMIGFKINETVKYVSTVCQFHLAVGSTVSSVHAIGGATDTAHNNGGDSTS